MRKKLTNKDNYEPKCAYCTYGRLSPNGENILCSKKGIMDPDNSCRRYKYDVLKRKPKSQIVIRPADPEDFKL